jgi:hypothetical protein
MGNRVITINGNIGGEAINASLVGLFIIITRPIVRKERRD